MHQNLFPNELLCWESIKYGKNLGCKVFDMWGASVNPEDKTDEWYGFTNFKLGFGGTHVVYIDSFDLVVNPTVYSAFNLVNDVRWKFLRLKRS
jgi:lipid II:glycine glycyltransferase (peptidoglycan interpeptide bridge formation enzyme)